jgi:hypothetical protein
MSYLVGGTRIFDKSHSICNSAGDSSRKFTENYRNAERVVAPQYSQVYSITDSARLKDRANLLHSSYGNAIDFNYDISPDSHFASFNICRRSPASQPGNVCRTVILNHRHEQTLLDIQIHSLHQARRERPSIEPEPRPAYRFPNDFEWVSGDISKSPSHNADDQGKGNERGHRAMHGVIL